MENINQFKLLGSRRFLPLFVTQFLGALNDNIFKNALVMLITYRIAVETGQNGQILVTLAGGLFILPFFLFSATAGQVADRMEKSQLIRLTKIWEIFLIVVAVVGFYLQNLHFLLSVLFFLGMQSAFFGPVKYAILPAHLQGDELIGGNALVEAGTFIAILLGTIGSGLLILTKNGVVIVCGAMLVVAVAGWLASRAIPRSEAAAPELKINPNFLWESWSLIRYAGSNRRLFLSILGISWFWFIGATFLSQFPTFAKDVLRADQEVVTLFLTIFSIGIGVGSLLCNRLLAGVVDARYVPIAALGITFFAVDLFFASSNSVVGVSGLMDAGAFLGHAVHWRVLGDLFLLAVCGGIYIVPLYALLQIRSDESHRSRVIAANNIINALFMVVSAIGTMAMLSLGYTVPQVFLAMGLVNLVVALYICGLLPDAILKMLFVRLFKLFYRVELRGWEHYQQAGERVVIVVNHVSFLDAALLAAFLPGKACFAINTQIAETWWVKPFLNVIDAFPMDPTNPFSIKALTKAVAEGRRAVIFPEGRITVTGALMKVYEGPGMIADKAKAMLLPVRIDGAQYTPLSRLKGKIRLRWFPKITITMLPPQTFALPDDLTGRVRRQRIGLALYDLLTGMLVDTCNARRTLFQALLDARSIHGGQHVILEDITRAPMTYARLITASIALGRPLAAISQPGDVVGLLLPNVVGAAAAFFGLQSEGRTPAMLNYSTGQKNLLSACATAKIKVVITSRRFVAMAKLEETIEALSQQTHIIYLETVRQEITVWQRLHALVRALFGHYKSSQQPDDPAVVLFTSGSEGVPKGVVLSHANILSNCFQLTALLDYNATDIVFNPLPIFHSFGLTGGLILPMMAGIKTFLYPSPLHYRIVPELVYDTNATILFGTDTFLAGYARMANPYDFYSLRYVFAGAEKVKAATRKVWSDKFGLRILEGYGSTETGPALSTNTPMHFKEGTVGRLLPAIRHRLEAVPGIDRGGRLIVTGPNIMLGYLRADRPGVLEPCENGEYDTGDIVEIDAMGFISIVGRVKRFAKIAGEMVSLAAAEELAAAVWPGKIHAVVALTDSRKGEQLILVTDQPGAHRDLLLNHAKEAGVRELMVPRIVVVVDKAPLLGSGKTDYVTAKVIATQAVGESM